MTDPGGGGGGWSPPRSVVMFDPRTPGEGGGGGYNTNRSPPGGSYCMDRGPTLVAQGGATVSTYKSLCGVGRRDPGTEC